jgi:hypothetical protein
VLPTFAIPEPWKSADRRYLGLTRGTWTALVAVAYLLGLSLMFAA